MSDTPDYLAWCRNKGYATEDNIFDALYAVFFWPFAIFMPNTEKIRQRQYNMDIREGRWKPYEIPL